MYYLILSYHIFAKVKSHLSNSRHSLEELERVNKYFLGQSVLKCFFLLVSNNNGHIWGDLVFVKPSKKWPVESYKNA